MASRRVLSRAARGVTLNQQEIAALLDLRGDDLRELMATAARLRDLGIERAGRPGTVTYSRKVFVPLTRLCRDRCHYCTFATDPASLRKQDQGPFLSPEQVLDIARRGAELGCKEALFTLGDQPEDRWPAARDWLEERGYGSTIDYVRAMAVLVLEETGLLPHLNPGVMTWEQLQRLRPVAPSMGMMLETTSRRLFETPGLAHYGSPDKDPDVRIRVLEDAGRCSVPFTTGLLIGIGETADETAEALLVLKRVSREFGNVQEVIIQNFLPKPDTAMRSANPLQLEPYLAALATARVVLGPSARIQAPPNLSDPTELALLLNAGVDDWGGVSPLTPDHVNPERPWPHLDELARLSKDAGFELTERLTVHPSYVQRPGWIDPQLAPHVMALANERGLARPDAIPVGLPWQRKDAETAGGAYEGFASEASGRVDLNSDIDTTGRSADRRSDFSEVYGDWGSLGDKVAITSSAQNGARDSGRTRAALDLAAIEPAALAEPDNAELALALMMAQGPELAELASIADQLRRERVGEEVSYVVNRNLNFTNVCYTGCRFCAFAQREDDPDAFTLSLDEVQSRVREAVQAGATEICMQGGIHPRLPGEAYFDLARAVKSAEPEVHLHAFSPMEVVNGAAKSDLSIRQWLQRAKDAGVDSIPGTAAEILDDEVRWILTKGKLPTSSWIEVIQTAHSLGIRSSATMMYGHVDHPRHWVDHLRLLRQVGSRHGGFTEFVGLPFIHHNAPVYLAGYARPGSTRRDDVAVTAMARLMLDGVIENIQVSWVKLGADGCVDLLQAGANDLGGTLMEETISRMAGSEYGSSLTVPELQEIAARAGRPTRQRHTDYRVVL